MGNNFDTTNLNKHFDTIYDVWCKVLTSVGINVKTTSRKLFKRDADYAKENNINSFDIRGIINTFFDINVSKYIVKFTKYKDYEEMLNGLAEANFEQIWLINRYLKYLCLLSIPSRNPREMNKLEREYQGKWRDLNFRDPDGWFQETLTDRWKGNYEKFGLYFDLDNNQLNINELMIHVIANTH